MKATIERATLLKSLGHVQSVVERRNTIPILSNVLIEAAAGGGLKLMATDLDLQIVETVDAQVETAGSTTVSAHTLFDIARKLPEGSQVQLTASEGKMLVVAGRARFNLSTLPRDDFPVIAEGDLPTRFELPAATLRQIIDKTRFAISPEETRYYLNGIFLHVTDEAQPLLKAAATDVHRLARVTVPRPEGAAGMPDVIVPRKCVGELR
ncbi:MAG: polymerase subunit beta, partial [Sphingomonas bacterium]|nr:polymerase subunit beta [Sphingomonas bacterium]